MRGGRDTADLHDVDHGEVAGLGRDRVGHAAGEPPVLAGLNGNRRYTGAHAPVAVQVVRGHRLLDPGQVVLGEHADARNGVRDLNDWL